MSVLLFTEDGWIISHYKYLSEIYKKVEKAEKAKKFYSLKFHEKYFDIKSQFFRSASFDYEISSNNDNKESRKRKRKKNKVHKFCQDDSQETTLVKEAYRRVLSDQRSQQFFTKSDKCDNNDVARLASKNFDSEGSLLNFQKLHGANRTEFPVVATIDDQRYVFPEKCSFYAHDVRDMEEKHAGDRYNFILMDPPWWNKSVRRKKKKCAASSYEMMYDEDLAKIPIPALLTDDGIVAVWCTNAPGRSDSVINEFFPSWGLVFAAKWYWIKVTRSGKTICDWNTKNGKKTYELLIFGRKLSKCNIPDKKVIIGVPSCIHSHKPPINELVKPYLKDNSKCLEIFARYLLPNWTSWGLQVLKFQHLSLYSAVEEHEIQQDSTQDVHE